MLSNLPDWRHIRVAELRELPPTLTVPQLGQIMGWGRSTAYEAVRQGVVPSVRVNRRIVVPTLAVLRVLGLDDHSE
jgi:hypothetical protein